MPYFASTAASLRCRTGTRKFPLPQAGSRNRESMRPVSPLTRSSIFSTSHPGVSTSPWSATRFLDLMRFIGDGLLSDQQLVAAGEDLLARRIVIQITG